jgi:uncharacterized protein
VKNTPFSERHPYWFVAFLELAIILTYLVAGTIAHFQGREDGLWLYGLANVALIIIGAGFLTRMRWWGKVGFCRVKGIGNLRFYVVLLVPAVLNLIAGIEIPSPISFFGFLSLALMVGFAEEVFFRGLMLQALRPKGVWPTALITAALFGITHLMNGLAGRDLLELAAQVAYAVAVGFAFAAVVVRKGVIWPLVLVHALIDFVAFLRPSGFVATPEATIVNALEVTAIFLVYGLVLMFGGNGNDREIEQSAVRGSTS